MGLMGLAIAGTVLLHTGHSEWCPRATSTTGWRAGKASRALVYGTWAAAASALLVVFSTLNTLPHYKRPGTWVGRVKCCLLCACTFTTPPMLVKYPTATSVVSHEEFNAVENIAFSLYTLLGNEDLTWSD